MFLISLLCSYLKVSECLKCMNLMYKYIEHMNQTCRVTLFSYRNHIQVSWMIFYLACLMMEVWFQVSAEKNHLSLG